MSIDAPNDYTTSGHQELTQSNTSAHLDSSDSGVAASPIADDAEVGADHGLNAGKTHALRADALADGESQKFFATGHNSATDSDETNHALHPIGTPATAEPAVEQLSDSERMAFVEQMHPRSETGDRPEVSESGDGAEPTASERMMVVEGQQVSPQLLRPAINETDDNATDKLPRGPDTGAGNDAAASGLEPTAAGVAIDDHVIESPRPRDIALPPPTQEVCKRWGVDAAEGVAAVQRSYDVVKDKVAPFLVHHVAKLIEDCKAEVATDPDRRYAFLGRDGYPLAGIVATLDPEFYVNHCGLLPVTRLMLEPALRDDEVNAGKKFHIDAFRKYKDDELSDADIDGAKFGLTEHLENNNFPVTEPGLTITVIDTSRKGSTQEGLAALYPHINWQGKYLCFEQSPEDPHPGTKTGYALHKDATDTNGESDARKPPEDPEKLPEDRNQTFAYPDAVLSIEDLLHGPWSSPRLDAEGQSFQQPEMPPIDELNPLDISPPFQDASTRLAAAEAMVIAVRDRAYEAMRQRDAGEDWRGVLAGKAEEFVDDLRSWISGDEIDPHLAEVLGSFARRIDRPHVAELRAAITESDLDAAETDAVWRGYKQVDSLEAKRAYVTEFKQNMEQP